MVRRCTPSILHILSFEILVACVISRSKLTAPGLLRALGAEEFAFILSLAMPLAVPARL